MRSFRGGGRQGQCCGRCVGRRVAALFLSLRGVRVPGLEGDCVDMAADCVDVAAVT